MIPDPDEVATLAHLLDVLDLVDCLGFGLTNRERADFLLSSDWLREVVTSRLASTN